MLRLCRIRNYRSVHHLDLPLDRVTVLVGANGTGKTNCYRALQLAHAAACGRLAEHFLEEGGMPSALWAGRKSRSELREVRLSVTLEHADFTYHLACGLPVINVFNRPTPADTPHTPSTSHFRLDPQVKEEDVAIRVPEVARSVPLCERRNLVCSLRDDAGERILYSDPLDLTESVLVQIADPRRFVHLALVRDTLVRWRFYHQFRTDRQAELRHPRLGVRSAVLAGDGANLAAALQTIIESHGEERLRSVIATAFPGQELVIERDPQGRMAVAMRKPGIHRTLSATELSDGTLRFLCLAAALLSPRLPQFLALNEPETSLHPDLMPCLAELIVAAGERSQVLVTTHAQPLADAISAATGLAPVQLVLTPEGETEIGASGDGPRTGDPGLLRRVRRLRP